MPNLQTTTFFNILGTAISSLLLIIISGISVYLKGIKKQNEKEIKRQEENNKRQWKEIDKINGKLNTLIGEHRSNHK